MQKAGSISTNSVPGGGKQSGIPPSVFLHSNCPSKFFFNDWQVGSSSKTVDTGGAKPDSSNEGRSLNPPRSSTVARGEETPASLRKSTNVFRHGTAGEFPAPLETGGNFGAPPLDSTNVGPRDSKEPAHTLADQRAVQSQRFWANARHDVIYMAPPKAGQTEASAAKRSITNNRRGGSRPTTITHGKVGGYFDLLRGYVRTVDGIDD